MATTVTLKPNAIDISGSTSGTTTLQATAVAGTTTLTLPAATDTLVGKATTDTLTNKTLTGAVMNGTVGATTPSTGAFTTLSATDVIKQTGNPSLAAAGATEAFVAHNTGYGAVLYGQGTTYDVALLDRNTTPRLTVTTTAVAVTGTINANGGSANPLPSNFSILATSGVAKLYSYWSDNSGRGSFEFHVAGGNGSLDLTAFTITDGASAKVKNVVSVGDATPSTSGAGITFPATQSASTNANTLDDYEEGVFTALVAPSTSGTITLNGSIDALAYTKIGRVVYVQGLLEILSVSSPVGTEVYIQNLPFAIADLVEYSGRGGTAFPVKAAARPVTLYESQTQVVITMDASILVAGDQFYITFNYIAA